jgi:hypothetical protein
VKLAFLHVGQESKYAEMMVASVRRFGDIEALQLTDMDTPAIEGCTPVRRVFNGAPTEPIANGWNAGGENLTMFKMEHLANLEGEILILDTDIIVQKDLSPVFSFDFDVALTWRDGPIWADNGQDLAKIMPINCGVMFSRSPDFWKHCLEWSREHPGGWYSDQFAVAANWRRFNVLRLNCDNFNHTPNSKAEDVSKRYVVHYKGKRKAWMC